MTGPHKTLDVGCGNRKRAGAIGIDRGPGTAHRSPYFNLVDRLRD